MNPVQYNTKTHILKPLTIVATSFMSHVTEFLNLSLIKVSTKCCIIDFIVHVSSHFLLYTLHCSCFIFFPSVYGLFHSIYLPLSISFTFTIFFGLILQRHSTLLSASLFSQSRLWKLTTYKCLQIKF